MKSSVLLVECADRPGLVHAISGTLFRHGLNVVGNQEFVDRPSARFYMRTEFDGPIDAPALLADIRTALPPDADVRLSRLEPKRIVVLASKEHHCLADVLVRNLFREFNAEVVAVAANHDLLAPLTRKFDIPFHLVPSTDRSREAHEAELLGVVGRHEPDFVVLAKYMRVLSPEFVRRFPARIVNIHHSFLPAFAGARPYHQAFERGVKVIGATAHYVTPELDAGPIIEQEITRVSHRDTVEDLVRKGKDLERMVLSRALRMHLQNRVLTYGNRTVVFE